MFKFFAFARFLVANVLQVVAIEGNFSSVFAGDKTVKYAVTVKKYFYDKYFVRYRIKLCSKSSAILNELRSELFFLL